MATAMSVTLGTATPALASPNVRAVRRSRSSAVCAAAPLRNGARESSSAGASALRLQQRERSAMPEFKRMLTITHAKAEGQLDSEEIQAKAEDLLKQVKATWEKIDDKLAVGGLGFAALIVLWGSFGLISAIEKLPVVPQLLEIVGLLFTGWFVYRYLLFKPDREELFKLVDDAKSKITGQDNL